MPRRKGLYPTPRDLCMAAELGEVLVMDVPLFQRHFPADSTGDSCLRRLRQLLRARLIAQLVPELTPSPRNAIYRLTEQGAAWLAYHTGMPPRRMLGDNPKPLSLPHRLQVACAILAINDAVRPVSHSPLRWILEYDRLPDAPCNVPIPQQFILAEDFLALPTSQGHPTEQYGPPHYGDPSATLLKPRPDCACLLALPSEDTMRILYIEVDNGTETHTQLLRKFPAYHALLATRAFNRHWPDIAIRLLPRILFVFRTEERLDSVLHRLRANPTVLWDRPRTYTATDDDRKRALAFLDQYFRFTSLHDLREPSMLTLPVWRTVGGQPKTIYRPRESA